MSPTQRKRTTTKMLMGATLALALVAGAGGFSGAAAQVPTSATFPKIPIWAFPGAYQDSSLVQPLRCVGAFNGPLADSVREQPRTITVRFLRDRIAESRPDFGGYRIYRVINSPDSTRMSLIRRFSRNLGDERTWNFSVLDSASLTYRCGGRIVNDSIVTFIDADSNGSYQKVCRRLDRFGRCLSRGDSVFRLVVPPGPHDGFRTWYSITYEKLNTISNDYEDLFIPDTLDNWARCGTFGNRLTCPNLNNKLTNLTADGVEPTGGPTPDLQAVHVVPNPFRGSEVWEGPGASEMHFVNLPERATIKIYTASGDLVRVLEHDDSVRDFERWDLKSGRGRDVASGIYLYRVEADRFTFQNRFVVIR